MHGENPYKASAGAQTDRTIHQRFFGNESAVLPYSTEEAAADLVKSRIKAVYGYPVHVGQTKTRPRRFFARFDSGPSTATEALAETLPLAICRLALVVSNTRNPATQ